MLMDSMNIYQERKFIFYAEKKNIFLKHDYSKPILFTEKNPATLKLLSKQVLLKFIKHPVVIKK